MKLSDVKSSCRLLESDKITERKKGAVQLRHLLNNSKIICVLDAASNNENRNLFNWDSVFYSAYQFFIKESKKVEDDERKNDAVSACTLNNRKAVLTGAPGMVLMVLHKSSAAGPTITLRYVKEFVLSILNRERPYLTEKFSSNAMLVAKKYLFHFPKYYHHLDSKLWKDLLRYCLWIYKNVENVNKCEVINTLKKLVICCQQCSVPNNVMQGPILSLEILPKFLKESFLSNTNSRETLAFNLLSLMHTLCETMATEWRRELCQLSEETFTQVLKLWENRIDEQQLALLQYLNTMLMMHYPCKDGTFTSESEFCTNTIIWRRNLNRLYQLIDDQLTDLALKFKISSGNKTEFPHISQDFVNLAARLCCKVFDIDQESSVIDVTQIDQTQARKRRKFDIGLVPLCQTLKIDGLERHSIPWLLIMNEMLATYSGFFNQARSNIVLEAFTFLLVQCKKPVVQQYLMKCLKSLAVQYVKVSSSQDNCSLPNWSKVWDHTLRIIVGKQCVKEGMVLLRTLLQCKLVCPDLGIFRYFMKIDSELNEESLEVLFLLIHTSQFPNYLESIDSVFGQKKLVTTRKRIIEVLLPSKNESDSHQVLECNHPELVVLILLALQYRDPTKCSLKSRSSSKTESKLTSVESLQDLYLISNFYGLSQHPTKNENNISKFSAKENNVIDEVQRDITQSVLEFVKCFISEAEVYVEGTDYEFNVSMNILNATELLTRLMLYISNEEFEEHLLKLISFVLKVVIRRIDLFDITNHCEVITLVNKLSTLYNVVNFTSENDECKSNLGRLKGLYKVATNFSCIKKIQSFIETRSKVPESTLNATMSATSANDDDFFDGEFLSESHLDSIENFHDDSFEELTDQITIFKLDDLSSLTPSHQCTLSCMEWMSAEYLLNTEENDNTPFITLITHFLDLSEVKQSMTTRLVVSFVQTLCSMKYKALNIDDALQMLINTAKNYSKDVETVSVIVDCICRLLHHNGSNLSNEQQINIMHLIKLFVKKNQEGEYGYLVTKSLMEVTFYLYKVDPVRSWSTMDNNLSEKVELSNFLCMSCHKIQISAVEKLFLLYIDNNGKALPAKVQNERFKILYQTALEIINSNVNSLTMEKDVLYNKQTIFLLILGKIAIFSDACESQAVYAIFRATKLQKLDVGRAILLLKKISECKKIDIKVYVENHLTYACSMWVKEELQIKEFPISLLFISEVKDFYEKYVHIIFPICFDQDKLELMKDMAVVLNLTIQQLMTKYFATLMASLAPSVVTSCNSLNNKEYGLSNNKIQLATRRYKLLLNILGEPIFAELLQTNLGEITFELLTSAYPTTPINEDIVIPSTSIFNYHPTLVEKTIEFFEATFSLEQSLIGLLANSGESLQKVFIGIQARIANADTKSKMRSALMSAQVLTSCILPHLGGALVEMQFYILRNLINLTSLYLEKIANFEVNYIILNNNILIEVLQEALKICPNVLANYTTSLVCRLSMLLDKVDVNIQENIETILNCLFNCSNKIIYESFSSLQLFSFLSENEVVQRLQKKHNEILKKYDTDDFVSKVHKFVSTPLNEITKPMLLYFLDLFKKESNEISVLYKNVSENNVSIAHQLVYLLMKLLSSSDNSTSILVAEILGYFGPRSFKSSVFPGEMMSKEDVHSILIVNLNNCLDNFDIAVVKTASRALISLLQTRDGFQSAPTVPPLVRQQILSLIPKTKPPKKSNVNIRKNFDLLLRKDLWKVKNFDNWIKNLTSNLIDAGCDCSSIQCVKDLCKIEPKFSADCLPYVVHNLLTSYESACMRNLSESVNFFFKECLKVESSNCGDKLLANKAAINVMLNVINYLRLHIPKLSLSNKVLLTEWDRNLWLDLDFLSVAEAAFVCGAHVSALLFIEIYHEINQDKIKVADGYEEDVLERCIPPLQKLDKQEASKLNVLLLKIFNALDNRDGIDGCTGSNKSCNFSRSLKSQFNGLWSQSLAVNDAQKSYTNLVTDLKLGGLYNTLYQVSSSLSTESQTMLEAQWECAWRLGQWDHGEVDVQRNDKSSSFNYSYFNALKSLHKDDAPTLLKHIVEARQNICNELKGSISESTSYIYQILTQFQFLSEVEQFGNYLSNSKNKTKFLVDIHHEWEAKDNTATIEYKFNDTIISSRLALLQSLNSTNNDVLFDLLLKRSRTSRQNSLTKLGICEHAITVASKLELTQQQSWQLDLENAKVSIYVKDDLEASNILKTVITSIQDRFSSINQTEKITFCEALITYGEIMMKSSSGFGIKMKASHFDKAVNVIEREKSFNEKYDLLQECYHKMATFSDKMYDDIQTYLCSDAVATKKKNITQLDAQAKKVSSLMNATRKNSDDFVYHRRQLVIFEQFKKSDEMALQQSEKELERNLLYAIEHHLKVLSFSGKYDLNIFRILSLWFNHVTSEKANDLIETFLSRIKTHKFIPVLYQLSARLTVQDSCSLHHPKFKTNIFKLLQRLCIDHPHHALPIILMLSNAHKDDEIKLLKENNSKNNKKRNGSKINNNSSCSIEDINMNEEDRVKAAKYLVNNLKKESLSHHIHEMEGVYFAYLEVANWSYENKEYLKTTPMTYHKLDKTKRILSLKNLQYTSALTHEIVVQPSCQYNTSKIVKWSNEVLTVGGVNSPIRLTVYTSDGCSSRELLKGNDDLRQDAVLEQVFNTVNILLSSSNEAKLRKLKMRTYIVTPLSQKTGLLQWCDNTQPYGAYLVGDSKKKGAHERYYPNDYTLCYKKLDKAKKDGLSPEERFELFKNILENFHPVFRHFFLEMYPYPGEWYQKRDTYTRSVATSSIIGYIFGLGDRHTQNLLLDTKTAEIIHIDLGMAFEFASIVLPTPETVPFRLTQDMVDGLGILGIEGPLRKCMEVTLQVLRESRECLITIIEVLRHDPLHQWTLSPTHLAKLQTLNGGNKIESSYNSTSLADKAVVRVKQKLAGVEDGYAKNVSEQVSGLLQEATDVFNLSQLFHGWKAYI